MVSTLGSPSLPAGLGMARYLSKGGVGPPDGAAIYFFGGPVRGLCRSLSLGCGGVWSRRPAPLSPILWPPCCRPADEGRGNGDRPPRELSECCDRWPGMTIELTVPDGINFADCDGGQFRSWGPENNVRSESGSRAARPRVGCGRQLA